ncbi:hypothetical protein CWS02_11995 [Enterobacter sp. EA-1]|nr:hypothetical protein CWS02_11995 [Enterobacter sp. EA-1]
MTLNISLFIASEGWVIYWPRNILFHCRFFDNDIMAMTLVTIRLIIKSEKVSNKRLVMFINTPGICWCYHSIFIEKVRRESFHKHIAISVWHHNEAVLRIYLIFTASFKIILWGFSQKKKLKKY